MNTTYENILYTLTPADPHSHIFDVSVTIQRPTQPFQRLSLPNWIPGSYLIRDFSKHIISIQAQGDNQNILAVDIIDKSSWKIENNGQPMTVSYKVYAWDLSVRGAHFDSSHAFFNGTSVFLAVEGQRDSKCEFELISSKITQAKNWKVATGLPTTLVDEAGFGRYVADDYSTLIDHPFELGNFAEINFIACGVPHKVVLTGLFNFDEARLKADLMTICEYEINFFGGKAPMKDYLFQVMVTGNDYGGLEHHNSTALMCSRNDLPYIGMDEASEGYLQFLELCSHEYFHTWNVKRIQPEVYQAADLSAPVYTNQLWWFEGVTSYYDSLILLRSGLINNKMYLRLLAKQMTLVYRMLGRFKQSVAESSLLTWTKFYQQDENSPNAIISYYTKGSLIALSLDLTIRIHTQNNKSLDDVLLYLWKNYGQTKIGLEELKIEQICSDISGIDLSEFFNLYLYGKEDIPLESLFMQVGITFKLRQAVSLTDTGGASEDEVLNYHIGANLEDTQQQTVKITHIWQQQPANKAGLSAGDELIAINGVKVSNKQQIETLLKRSQSQLEWSCHYFRRDELRQCQLKLSSPPLDRVGLSEFKRLHLSAAPLIDWL